jgi:2-hydroxycyclohexanecarboxyl-CoA dehydrogenase
MGRFAAGPRKPRPPGRRKEASVTSLAAKVALVTGAGSGIGRAIACRLASAGARVAVVDIDAAGAAATVARIRDAGGEATAVEADVTAFEQAQAAVERVRALWGGVDILVNNAGWDQVEPFVKNTPELWDRIIAINLRGPIHFTRAVLDDMIAKGSGKIVFISSDAARVGSSGEAVYSACKGGMISFAKTLARELARHRINVNVVCPGPTRTPLLDRITSQPDGAKVIEAMTRAIPFRRLGEPEDVAAAVAFFASSDADYVTGQVLSVSGGLTMVG